MNTSTNTRAQSTTNICKESASLLSVAFAQGKSNQQAFSLVRNKGFSITYQQVQQHRTAMDISFNSAFNSIFIQ
jgi:hypothetical protein